MQSRGKALVAVTGLYALFLLVWDAFLVLLQFVTVGSELPESGLPEWIRFVGLLNPTAAFPVATRAFIPEFSDLTRLPESDTVFLQDWVGFVVLTLWLVVPIVVGYLRFNRVDLG